MNLCPYCNEDQEIIHDGGDGYDENVIYDQQCRNCSKIFVYTVCYSIDHYLAEAPCLNGEPHKVVASFTMPVKYTRMECGTCSFRRPPTDAEMAEVLKSRNIPND